MMCAEPIDTPVQKPRPRWLKYLLRGFLASVLLFVISVLVLGYIFLYGPYLPDLPTSALKVSFDGDSRQLAATQIVPTLDTPVEPGKNVIYCASFIAAWKSLQNDVAGSSISIAGAGEVSDRLNSAADPKDYVPAESLYAAAGWVNKGILDTIASEMHSRFPAEKSPDFPGITPDSFVAFAHMEASVHFTTPYFDSREPLIFTGGDGSSTKVRSFGIREKDSDAYSRLRAQPQVLFVGDIGLLSQSQASYFAIDLCGDFLPSQVIVAHMDPRHTLAEMLAFVNERIAASAGYTNSLGPTDVLLVPDMLWRLVHHYDEIEKSNLSGNKPLGLQPENVAMQSITFRLDRSGAELKSQVKSYVGAMPVDYVLDRPFLVIMKERSATEPYFVMWVDNAELLQKW